MKKIVDILLSNKKEDGTPLISKTQAESLADLKFKNNDYILIPEDENFLYEIIWMLNKLGYEKVYNFLSRNWEEKYENYNEIRKKLLFESPLLKPAQEQLDIYLDVYKTKIEVSAGERCKKCGSDNTISIIAQTRSADEAQTIKIQCLQCKFKWTAQ